MTKQSEADLAIDEACKAQLAATLGITSGAAEMLFEIGRVMKGGEDRGDGWQVDFDGHISKKVTWNRVTVRIPAGDRTTDDPRGLSAAGLQQWLNREGLALIPVRLPGQDGPDPSWILYKGGVRVTPDPILTVAIAANWRELFALRKASSEASQLLARATKPT